MVARNILPNSLMLQMELLSVSELCHEDHCILLLHFCYTCNSSCWCKYLAVVVKSTVNCVLCVFCAI